MEQHFYTLCALALKCANGREKKSSGNFGISQKKITSSTIHHFKIFHCIKQIISIVVRLT